MENKQRKKLKRLSEREVKLIIEAVKIGFTTRELGRAFRVTHPSISYVVKYKSHAK